jgi:anthraniloyl-CoA monooxygenase
VKLRRVAVLGGGPGGLYAARLMKLAYPDCRVDVYEQGLPDTTFGFGVGLAAGTQRNLRTADVASLDNILRLGHAHDMSLRVAGEVAHIPNDSLRAIGRTTLLAVLQEHATAAGAHLHFGERRDASTLDAELVIAADGVSSATRDAHATSFGAQVDVGDGLYLWCGTDFALDSALFMPVTTEYGTFVTHAYPYAPDRSTFLIETDEHTWRSAGFDTTTDATPLDGSDQHSLSYLRQVFVEPLQGHPLIGNRTRWLRFRTVHSESWHHDNIVLLGDAAHTAHYSIGSGTKLAMEDAIALIAALRRADSLDAALHSYEADRRPAVEHLQAVAARSQRWWDSFPSRMHLPIHQLLVSYMTRAGKVSLPRFAETAPQVVQRALGEYHPAPAGQLSTQEDLLGWIVRQPLRVGDSRYPTRASAPGGAVAAIEVTEFDPWGAKADSLLDLASAQLASGATAVRLTGGGDRDAVLDRLDVGERIRLQLGGTVIVQAAEQYLPDLAGGLLAGRTDLIDTTG